jgi:hypothetical protein
MEAYMTRLNKATLSMIKNNDYKRLFDVNEMYVKSVINEFGLSEYQARKIVISFLSEYEVFRFVMNMIKGSLNS